MQCHTGWGGFFWTSNLEYSKLRNSNTEYKKLIWQQTQNKIPAHWSKQEGLQDLRKSKDNPHLQKIPLFSSLKLSPQAKFTI